MLELRPHKNRGRTNGRAKRAAELCIHAAFKRAPEVVGERLAKMIAVGQRRSADGNPSAVDRLKASRRVARSIQQAQFVGEFLLQTGLQVRQLSGRTFVALDRFASLLDKVCALDASPGLQADECSFDVTERGQLLQSRIHPT